MGSFIALVHSLVLFVSTSIGSVKNFLTIIWERVIYAGANYFFHYLMANLSQMPLVICLLIFLAFVASIFLIIFLRKTYQKITQYFSDKKELKGAISFSNQSGLDFDLASEKKQQAISPDMFRKNNSIFSFAKYPVLITIAIIIFVALVYVLPEKYQLANLVETSQRDGAVDGESNLVPLAEEMPAKSLAGQAMVLAEETVTNDKDVTATSQLALDPNKKTATLTGILTDKKGNLVDGTYEVRFAIYTIDRTEFDPYPSDSDQGMRIWEETQIVAIKKGVFNVNLGQVNDLPFITMLENSQFYIGTRIGMDSEMVPRKKINTPFFSINSINALLLNGKKIGPSAGNIVALDAQGKIDLANLPTGNNTNQLVLGSDNRLKYTISGSKFLTLSGQTFTAGKVNLSSETKGTLLLAGGGTGLSSYTSGDLIYYSSGKALSRLPLGVSNQVLRSNGTNLVWADESQTIYTASGNLLQLTGNDFSLKEGTLTSGQICTYDAVTGLNCTTTAGSVGVNYWELAGNNLYPNDVAYNVGIGTSSPTAKLDVTGNITLSGNILRQNSSQSIGSSTNRFYYGYFDYLDVTNMSIGGVDISGTTSNTLTVNSDNATADTEDGFIAFERGSLTPNAQIRWDATNDLFDFNFPLSVSGVITATGGSSSNWNTAYSWGNHASVGYLTGTKVDSFNTRTGAVTLSSLDVTNALTYTPYNATNPAGYISDGNTGWDNSYGFITNLSSFTTDNLAQGTTNLYSQWGTNGVMIYYNAGNVGIGTTNPLFKLDVNGDINIASGNHFKINGVNLAYSDIGAQQAYTNISTIGALANSTGWLYNNGTGTFSYTTPTGLISALTAGYLPYATSGTVLGNSGMYYDGSKNLGIGTTAPDATFSVYFPGGPPGNSALFKVSNNFVVMRYGNVGVGTTNPLQKLSIEGTLGILEGGTAPQYYTVFQGGDQNANLTYTLPVASGTDGQVLKTDSGNNLYWATVAGGSGGIGTVTSVGSGNGLTGGPITSTGTLSISLLSANGGTASTSSYSGLQFSGASDNQLSLLQGCANNEVLSWDNSTKVWKCASVSGVGGVTGSGTANYLTKWSSTSGLASSVIYETGGNIGIGTTNPLYKLDVNGDIDIATGNHFKINGSNLTYSDVGAQQSNTNLNSLAGLIYVSGSFVKMTGANTFTLDTNTYLTSYSETDPVVKAITGIVKSNGTTISAATAGTDYIAGNVGANHQMAYFTASGTLSGSNTLWFDGTNVGIGTTSPVYKLDIRGASTAGQINAEAGLCINGDCKTSWGSSGIGTDLWTQSGSNIFYISGNVGIGTTAPVSGLEVASLGTFSSIPTGIGIGQGSLYVNPAAYTSAAMVSWSAKPAWNGPNLSSVPYKIGFGDLDNDGDYDMLIGDFVGDIYGYENTGTTSSPTWTAKTAWDLLNVGDNASPALADLDNDGDLDLMVGNDDFPTKGYENTGTASSPIWVAKSSWDIARISSSSYPTMADLDNDGDFDILIGQGTQTAYAYENTGTASAPVWTAKSAWNEAGSCKSPSLGDLDGDGDYDLFCGQSGTFTAYENTGTVSSPTWTVKSDWNGAGLRPSLVDLDGDGDMDFIQTNVDPAPAYENTGSLGAAVNTIFGVAVNGSEKLKINGLGQLSLSGSLTSTNLINATYGGTLDALSINQTGLGNIVNFKDGGISAFIIKNGGNIGIGATNPQYKLDVAGDLNITGNYKVNGINLVTGMGGSGTANYLPMFATGTTLGNSAIYQSSGNVGVGTTSPLAKLHLGDTGSLNGIKFGDLGDVDIYRSGNNILRTDDTFISGIIKPDDNGSATTPAYSFNNDSNTGLFLGGNNSDILGFATNGTEALRIISSGNIGIGTTAPVEILDINGRLVLAQTTAPVTTTNKLYNVSGNLLWNGINLTGGGSLPTGLTGQTIHNNAGTWTATNNLYNDGTNVGIGTTNPGSSLDINSTAALNTQFLRNGSVLGYVDLSGNAFGLGAFVNHDMKFSVASGQSFSFGGGNVGIGTTAPNAMLALAESTSATGGIAFGSDTSLFRSASNTLTASGNLNIGSSAPTIASSFNPIINTTVDSVGSVGGYTSTALGSDGFARISYYDDTNDDLKFVQCTNAYCLTKNTTTVDSSGDVGQYTSIAIGSDGFARISYYDVTNGDLKFVQCTNADCSAKNTTTVDSSEDVGQYTSMDIGSDGFARISYYDVTNRDLKFVQCTNADCSAKNTTTVDSSEYVGQDTSMAIGPDGFARISYYDSWNGDLKFAQCTNANCSAKNMTTVDSTGDVGNYTSTAIGSDGFARISYYDHNYAQLKFTQCTNADCSTKNTTTVDPDGATGIGTSIALGSDGFARISYYNWTNTELKFAQCTNADCSTKNTTTVDYPDDVGRYNSMAIGSDGSVSISYYDGTNSNLKFSRITANNMFFSDGNDLAISGSLGVSSNIFTDGSLVVGGGAKLTGPVLIGADTSNITGAYSQGWVKTIVDSTGIVGQSTSTAMGSDGFARISYHDATNDDLKFVQCTNSACSTKNITTVDSTGMVGWYTSMAIGSDGFARISYYDDTNDDLKFVQCTNADCSAKNITTVDSAGLVGMHTSTAIGSDGFARISYYDQTNGDLKFVQCTNADCSTQNITAVDSSVNVGQNTSMAIGSDGFARISYYDYTNFDLKFVQCTNATCSTKNIATVDSTGWVGWYTSIAIGSDGFARIGYFKLDDQDVKFIQCTNATCSTRNTTIVDSPGDMGQGNISIQIGSDGFARISYYDNTNDDLKFAQCTNADCSTKSITTVDSPGDVGGYASMAIGADDLPRISYYDSTNGDLKFAVRSTDSSRFALDSTTPALFLNGMLGVKGNAFLDGDLNVQGSFNLASGILSAKQYYFTSDGYTNLATLDSTGLLVNGAGNFTDVLAGSGTAALPSFHFSTDTNTGMYRAGSDNLRLVTAGADRLTIDSSGNIGIGTAAPTKKLALAGSFTLNDILSSYGPNDKSLALSADHTKIRSTGFGNPKGEYRTNNSSFPTSLAIGDLNNDGYADLAVSNNIVAGLVSVFLNNKDGTFAAKVDYTTGSRPRSVAIGDLNNDGYADLAVANWSSTSVSVFINNKNGTFATKVDYTTGSSPYSVAIGDLNNDGYADLAVANGGSTSVSVFINNKNGTFATKVDYTTGSSPYSVAIGDLNNDGYADLAVANGGSTSVSVFINNKDGTFATKVDYTTGSSPKFVAIGDLNNDGYADLAVANQSISIFINNKDGTFAAKIDYAAGSAGIVAIGDLNNDGYADLAVSNAGVSVLLNNKDGTFATRVDYAASQSLFVAIGDLNNDGYADIGTLSGSSNSAVVVFLNNKNGTFAAKVDYTTGSSPYSVAVGDVNNDGYADLAVANHSSASVSVFINNKNGTFATKVDYTTGSGPGSVAVGDLNNDGYADLAVTNENSDSVSVFLNNQDSTFANKVDYTTGSHPYSVAIGDLNNDGYSDLAVTNYFVTSASVLINNNDGTFAAKVDYTTGTQPSFVAIGDLNNDGYADLAVTSTVSNYVSIFLNNKDGTFAAKVDYATVSWPYSVVIRDLNNDGYADLAVPGGGYASVFINNKNGTFATKVDYATCFNPNSLAVGDLNNDGYADLAVSNYSSSSVSVFLNNKNGTFATKVDYTTGSSPYSVAIGDLNNDGYADLAVANYTSNSVSVLLNGTYGNEMHGDLMMDGRLLGSSGSATTPSIGFLNDLGTGLANMGTGILNLLTGGATRMMIDGNGNIGIGTTAPGFKLDVNGTANIEGALNVNSNIFVTGGYAVYADSFISRANSTYYVDFASSGISVNVAGNMNAYGAGNNYFAGNVGIGTTSPGAKLEIDSGISGVTGMKLTQVTSGSSAGAGNGKVLGLDENGNIILVTDQTGSGTALPTGTFAGQTLYYNGSNWVATVNLFNNGGNIGVSTTNPQGMLDLGGLGGNGSLYIGNGVSGSLQLLGDNSTGNATINNANTVGGNIQFQSRGADTVMLQQNGNVGIGTTAPVQKLDINGSAQIYNISGTSSLTIRAGSGQGTNPLEQWLDSSGNGLAILSADGRLGIGTTAPAQPFQVNSGTSAFVVASAGNVGIGTTNPSEKFSLVDGSFKQSYSNFTPTVTSIFNVVGISTYDIYLSGNYLYVASTPFSGPNKFMIFDISNPSAPVNKATVDTGTGLQAVFVSGKYAFLGMSGANAGTCSGATLTGCEFMIYDISNPSSPVAVSGLDIGSSIAGIYISGNYAYITKYDGGITNDLMIVDISKPASPVIKGGIDLGVSVFGDAKIKVQGKYAYIGTYGVAGTCSGTTLTGCEFRIYDISNPASPSPVGGIDTGGSSITGVTVSDGYAYYVWGGNDLTIVDVSNPFAPVATGAINEPAFTSADSIVVAGKYAYVGGGLGIFDVSDSTQPKYVGGFNPYVDHITYATVVSGKYAYIATYNEGIKVVDIGGIDSPAATIGSIAAGNLDVTNNAIFNRDVFVKSGFAVGGNAGITGDFAVNGTSFLFGNVGIGTTNPGLALDVVGNARFSAIGSGAYVGAVNRTADGTLTTSTSDVRLKQNISTIDNPLDKVMALRGVTFNWIDPNNPKRMLGMIAQEVMSVVPELVFQNPDGYYGINYGETSGLLIEAIKQQQGEITGITNNQNQIVAKLTGQLADQDLSVENKLQLIGETLSDLSVDTQDISSLQVQIAAQTKDIMSLTDQMKLLQDQTKAVIDFQLAFNLDKAVLKDSLGNIVLLDGKITAKDIEALGTLKAQDIEATNSLKGQNLELGAQVSGTNIIKAGALESVQILTTQAQQGIKLYITPKGSVEGKTLFYDEADIEPGVGFKVKIDAPALEKDIEFNWLIVK